MPLLYQIAFTKQCDQMLFYFMEYKYFRSRISPYYAIIPRWKKREKRTHNFMKFSP